MDLCPGLATYRSWLRLKLFPLFSTANATNVALYCETAFLEVRPMPSDPKRVQSIFLAAVDQATADRPAHLAAACGQDAELRGRVEQLLAQHELQESFFLDASPQGL